MFSRQRPMLLNQRWRAQQFFLLASSGLSPLGVILRQECHRGFKPSATNVKTMPAFIEGAQRFFTGRSGYRV